MIYELDTTDYVKVRPLFAALNYQPFCTAALAGLFPGRVVVDDPDHPQAAFVNTGGVWCFLAGKPDDDGFNRALNRALFDREIIDGDVDALFFTCEPGDWGGQLAVVCTPRQPIPVERRHYVCRELAYDWQANVPDGFTLRRMDETLLNQPGLKIPDDVKETLEKWRSIADPRLADFGFVAIDDDGNEVASWATVDAIVNGVGDAGLFTQEAYRRRGLAAVTTGAVVDYGLSSGLSLVSWTCAESNVGSIRTAEKLGFERERDYTMHYCCFDRAQHLGALAYHHLEGKRYQQAADLMERVLAMGDDPPCWIYYDAARVWAALGNRDKAFGYLQTAVDRGWTDVGGAEHCPEFEGLRGTPEWAACWTV